MEPRVLRIITERHFELAKPGPSKNRLHLVPDEEIFREEGLCLHPRARPCEDCDLMVSDRRITYSLKYYKNDDRAWIRKCTGCGVKTPVLKPFDNP